MTTVTPQSTTVTLDLRVDDQPLSLFTASGPYIEDAAAVDLAWTGLLVADYVGHRAFGLGFDHAIKKGVGYYFWRSILDIRQQRPAAPSQTHANYGEVARLEA